MCGIIGVTGVPDAARVAYLGLYSLQHRGQESGGMVAVDGEGVARSHRGMGLVSDIFNERVLSDLPGDVAIGHTRYSTAGTSVLANAQPMLARYREGPLALAHNGNLTNAVQLRSDLVAKGSLFQSSSDSEVLVHLIARSEAREPEDQLLDALERVEGAYSLLITVGRTLYAIVDPRGFRPLVLGRLGRGWVVASETCALDITGATLVRELLRHCAESKFSTQAAAALRVRARVLLASRQHGVPSLGRPGTPGAGARARPRAPGAGRGLRLLRAGLL